MFTTIVGAPFTDPFLRKDFIQYGLYSLACVIAVTLIYSIIFDTKKAPESVFIPCTEEQEDEEDEEAAREISEEAENTEE